MYLCDHDRQWMFEYLFNVFFFIIIIINDDDDAADLQGGTCREIAAHGSFVTEETSPWVEMKLCLDHVEAEFRFWALVRVKFHCSSQAGPLQTAGWTDSTW